MTVDLWTGLASLGLCLMTGIWVGHRWAVESCKLDAVITQTLNRLDLTPEDEADQCAVCHCLYEDPWNKNSHYTP